MLVEKAKWRLTATTATMKKTGGECLLGLVKQINDLSARCANLGIPPVYLESLKREIATRLEELPVHEDESYLDSNLPIMYFILAGNEWWPVRHGKEVEACGSKGWLNYRIDYKDGGSESGPCQPYRWAHSTADNMVNYHWFEDEE